MKPVVLLYSAIAIVSVNVAQAQQSSKDISFKSRFDGAYLGITGGYDFANSNADLTGPYPFIPQDSVHGAKFGGFAGFNATSGSILMGFEARAQHSLGESKFSRTSSASGVSFPQFLSWMQCYGCSQEFLDNYPTSSNPLVIKYNETNSVMRTRPWQADLSVRAGLKFDDWLVFAKLGGGAAQSVTKVTHDASGTQTCDPIVIRERPSFNEVRLVAVGCRSITPGAITQVRRSQISPIGIFGFGVERNFDSLFIRVEAEVTAHFQSSQTSTEEAFFYSPAVNASVGYRF